VTIFSVLLLFILTSIPCMTRTYHQKVENNMETKYEIIKVANITVS